MLKFKCDHPPGFVLKSCTKRWNLRDLPLLWRNGGLFDDVRSQHHFNSWNILRSSETVLFKWDLFLISSNVALDDLLEDQKMPSWRQKWFLTSLIAFGAWYLKYFGKPSESDRRQATAGCTRVFDVILRVMSGSHITDPASTYCSDLFICVASCVTSGSVFDGWCRAEMRSKTALVIGYMKGIGSFKYTSDSVFLWPSKCMWCIRITGNYSCLT